MVVASVPILRINAKVGIVSKKHCSVINNICHGQKGPGWIIL